MNIVAWIIFGLVTGIISKEIDPHSTSGSIEALILGILGALLGGFLSSLIFGVGISGFNMTSFVISILGALLFLFISQSFRASYE